MEILRRKRLADGLTLREFCRRTGLQPSYVSRIEAGLLTPPVSEKRLGRLLRAYGFTADDIRDDYLESVLRKPREVLGSLSKTD